MNSSTTIEASFEKQVLISIYTSNEVIRFKTKAPEDSQKYLESIFLKEFFNYNCTGHLMTAIIRTALITAIVLSDEDEL